MKIAPKIKLSYFELEGRAESMYVHESQGVHTQSSIQMLTFSPFNWAAVLR
jgi:hypothetical protein